MTSIRSYLATVGLLGCAFAVNGRASGEVCRHFDLQELLPPEPLRAEIFSSYIDADENYIVVSADDHIWLDGETLRGLGAAYVYIRDDSGVTGDPSDDTWILDRTLRPWTVKGIESMGFSVGIQLPFVFAGAYGDNDACPDDNQCRSGSVFVFRLDSGGNWQPHQKLTASDAAEDWRFGISLAVSGKWLAVGSVPDDEMDPGTGKVYMFRLADQGTSGAADDVWVEHEAITHPMGPPDDRFGQGVALHEDWMVVGAPSIAFSSTRLDSGAAYVYHRDDNSTPGDLTDDTWSYMDRLAPGDAEPPEAPGGTSFKRFALRLDIDNHRIIAGAEADGPNIGAAYVFRRDDNGTPGNFSDDDWFQEKKLVASDAEIGLFMGTFVLLNGDMAIVGADGDSEIVARDTGSVYIFEYVGQQWLETQKLLSRDGQPNDFFGSRLALSDEQVIVGALHDDSAGPEVGSAYVLPLINDCNSNCIPDADDIAAGTSADCDANGIPDECEDCTGNGLANACDIAAGALDCNANGLPDQCDRDCNGDGLPDDCAATCTDHCECNDFSACTLDYCVEGACTHTATAYGDVDGNAIVNLLDIFGILNQMTGANGQSTMHLYDIQPCHGDGVVNLFDVFVVLDVIGGFDLCWCQP